MGGYAFSIRRFKYRSIFSCTSSRRTSSLAERNDCVTSNTVCFIRSLLHQKWAKKYRAGISRPVEDMCERFSNISLLARFSFVSYVSLQDKTLLNLNTHYYCNSVLSCSTKCKSSISKIVYI